MYVTLLEITINISTCALNQDNASTVWIVGVLPSLFLKLNVLPPCPGRTLTRFPHWPDVSQCSGETHGSQILVSAGTELCMERTLVPLRF